MQAFYIANFVAARLGVDHYALNSSGEKHIGLDFLHPSNEAAIASLTGIFGPMRRLGGGPFVDAAKVVVFLRDPRDVLVSMFFSFAYSHSLRQANGKPALFDASGFGVDGVIRGPDDADRARWQRNGIDTFIREFAPFTLTQYSEYCGFLDERPDAVFLRYEDMVTDFPTFARRYVIFLGGDEAVLTEVLTKFDRTFDVQHEDHMVHKRQVLPGDHLRKLTPSTMEFLNAEFSAVLSRLGYAAQ